MQMKRIGLVTILPEPTTTSATTRIAKLATTNAPITVGLIRLPMTAYGVASLLSAGEKFSHARVFRMRQHVIAAGCDLGARFRIGKNVLVAAGEEAGQLMRDHDCACAEAGNGSRIRSSAISRTCASNSGNFRGGRIKKAIN